LYPSTLSAGPLKDANKLKKPARSKTTTPKTIPAPASHVAGGDKEIEPHIPESPVAKAAPSANSNLPSCQKTAMDKLFDEVFGDHMHDNLSTHFDGGIAGDALWQSIWQQLVEHPLSLCDIPSRANGKLNPEALAETLEEDCKLWPEAFRLSEKKTKSALQESLLKLLEGKPADFTTMPNWNSVSFLSFSLFLFLPWPLRGQFLFLPHSGIFVIGRILLWKRQIDRSKKSNATLTAIID
jgi:hypothetical protein